ncbi:hypothetical protein AURDEDRAFT_178241 [Auricularia subglabra TFB-10046 SS5]|uniref:Uncharacterized protein n=1 Tax=Auricularia subglabra (strain TFB-10046 / SS5) TaxID=717982 RepID=J0CR03_AURST|nr:hypothetical protein AURDEDRAFT_178241 [Auricularia subglabra TFB-10046 SS5]
MRELARTESVAHSTTAMPLPNRVPSRGAITQTLNTPAPCKLPLAAGEQPPPQLRSSSQAPSRGPSPPGHDAKEGPSEGCRAATYFF